MTTDDPFVTIMNLLPSLSMSQLSMLRNEVENDEQRRLRQVGVDGTLTEDELDAVRSNRLIEAVKSIRERTGLGIREAKNYLDKARARR